MSMEKGKAEKIMKDEEIRKFIDQVSNDLEAREHLKGYDASTDEIKAYAEVAAKLGYDITEGDLREYFDSIVKLQKERTEKSAAQIKKLSDDALEWVAGGKDQLNCKDTFEQRENCVWNDGCDIVINDYYNYFCSRNNYCHGHFYND